MHVRHLPSLRKSSPGLIMLAVATCIALCSCSGDPASPATTTPTDTGDNQFWEPFAAFSGPGAFIDAIRNSGGRLYIGGAFNTVDGKPFRNAVTWDGSRWLSIGGAVGTLVMGRVHVVLPDDHGGVYVAGMFDQVSGFYPASNIAYWDGANWNTMNGGTDIAVRALAFAPNGDLFVGGEFLNAGGKSLSRIARWDGTDWYEVGGGANQHIVAAVVHNGVLYVGGRFTQIGGKDIAYIARWDGLQWQAVGPALNGWVTSITFHGDDLYIGGGFTRAGQEIAGGIARLEGAGWKPLGQGISGPGTPFVRVLHFDGDLLYAGGFFTHVDGKLVNYIAKWDGDEWSALGSGVDYTVKNIERFGDALYITGDFRNAGGKPSHLIARWTQ